MIIIKNEGEKKTPQNTNKRLVNRRRSARQIACFI
jgi:hypothetical protein